MSSVESRGQFVWHELMTTDTAAAGAFYPRVAGWKSQPFENDPSYTLWMGSAGPLGGLMRLPEDSSAAPCHWMPYISTPDVAAAVEAARHLGAQVCKDTTEIPNAGTFAVLADPHGATFAVHATAMPATQGGAQPAEGDFSWHELATTDIPGSLSFYMELFGWGKGIAHDMGELGPYQLFTRDGKDIGGIYTLQSGVTTPHWLSYVRVGDVDKAARAAKAAGGRVIHGPMEVPGGDWIAQILDPQGAMFAVHELKQAVQPAQQATKVKTKTPAKPKRAKAAAKATPAKAKAKAKKTVRRASAQRAAAKKTASARKRAAGRRAASKRAVPKRAAMKRSSAARRRPAARKRVAKKKVTRRLRAKKRR